MDHAAAHERIEDLLLDPRRLAALEESAAPEDVALREHLAGCTACRADLDGWRSLEAAMTASLPHSAAEATSATNPIELPPSLRAAVLTSVRAEPRRGVTATATTSPTPGVALRRLDSRLGPLLALAASLIVIVGASMLVVDQANQHAAADREVAALTSAIAAVDRILAVPGHKVVQLHKPDGANAGSISWSRHDWVVLTTALERPPAGQRYLCWLVEENGAQVIGEMQFAGETAFWVASVERWATWEITPTTRFVVTLQPEGTSRLSSPPVLEAALGA